MGLDMFLMKKTYIGAHYKHRDVSGSINVRAKNKRVDIDFGSISEITEQVAYWRKANQIHNWFVENVQGGEDNCQDYEVKPEQLRKLLAECEKIIKHKDEALELMPTKSGFFFGSTDYDEYYFGKIQETIDVLKKILKVVDEATHKEFQFYYSSSW